MTIPPQAISPGSLVRSAITVGKDLVALLRDGSVFVLAVLLLAFPAQFNGILVKAGFKEGSVAGFKWQATLTETDDALKQAQQMISELQRKNEELARTLTDAGARLASDDGTLKAQIVELQAGNQSLAESVRTVQTSVDERLISNEQLVADADRVKVAVPADVGPATASAPTSRYWVGFQTAGLDPEVRTRINGELAAMGYQMSAVSTSYGTRPSWFATRSTVFYYATSALPAARELAERLQKTTGTRFAVQRGAGLGVEPDRRDVTLYVHHLQ
jgi:hypothetical protein